MDKKVIDYLSKVEGIKTRIKEIHWMEPTISGHELAGDVEDEIGKFEDSIAEDLQGVYGIDIDVDELSPVDSKSKTLRKLIDEVIEETEKFYDTLTGSKFIGARSDIENFLHIMNVKKYLARKTLHENKKQVKKRINESMIHKLIKSEIRKMIKG